MEDKDRVVKLESGEEVYIKDPNRFVRTQAESEGTKAYYQAIKDGCLTREKMKVFLRENGIWSEDLETQVQLLQIEMESLLDSIENGGIKESEAKENAIRVIYIRNELNELVQERISHLTETVEAKKRNAIFDWLVFSCTVYNNDRGKLFFGTFDEYLNKKDFYETNTIAAKCSEILYGVPDLDDTPEKRFLRERNFVDDQLRLINKDGHLVDSEDRLIDEEGRYIKYVGTGKSKKVVFVNIDGEEVKEEAKLPFLDENGEPIKETKTKSKK